MQFSLENTLKDIFTTLLIFDRNYFFSETKTKLSKFNAKQVEYCCVSMPNISS